VTGTVALTMREIRTGLAEDINDDEARAEHAGEAEQRQTEQGHGHG
jgi:hypothetical protein